MGRKKTAGGALVLAAVLAGAGLGAASLGGASWPFGAPSAVERGSDLRSEAGPEEAGPVEAQEEAREGHEGEGPEAEPGGERLRYEPSLPRWEAQEEALRQGAWVATAYQFNAPVYQRPDPRSKKAGFVRRGRGIRSLGRAGGRGCRGGGWFRVRGGFVCSSDGFALAQGLRPSEQRDADLSRPLPYRYAMVRRRGALRLHRLPTEEEEALLEASEEAEGEGDALPPERVRELVDLRMVGDYFLALDREERSPAGRSYFRTIHGEYVLASDLELQATPAMVGEHLEGAGALPLAFVFGERRPAYRIEGEEAERVGTADKHARFRITEERELGGRAYVIASSGLALQREAVRVARRIRRPVRIPAGTRWIHIDLSQQSLVAYEGDRPVYATLVSSGRPGYDTPRGVFRIHHKHVSITMRGADPHDGPYEVEEVPWTMYYWNSYALHGAYWHDDFGRVRSHGCTNLAPADAHWLFEWTNPRLPRRWHGTRGRGTWIYFTREASEEATQPPAEQLEGDRA